MKCQIRWIDSAGKPTPDSNDAVAMVKLHGAIRDEWLPICMDHLARYESDRERMVKTGWEAMPIVPACRCQMVGVLRNENATHAHGCPNFKP